MMDALFAYAIYPARVVCETCQVHTTVINEDQGRRWLRGHGETFHDGPFEVGLWSSVDAVRYDLEALTQSVQDLPW